MNAKLELVLELIDSVSTIENLPEERRNLARNKEIGIVHGWMKDVATALRAARLHDYATEWDGICERREWQPNNPTANRVLVKTLRTFLYAVRASIEQAGSDDDLIPLQVVEGTKP